ncbi:MAG TPA: glycosyltransferase family 39 protein [Candidatus Acidoferrales bacterium]|nr:glycosyltransferase family 39 protein [Candidatus Acidoferrales bacterium]
MAKRAPAILAAVLVLIATARIVSTYTVLSHTMDEPEHLGCGMQWLARGQYTWDPSHPPIARVLAIIGPYLDGARYLDAPGSHAEGILLLGHGGHYDRTLALARMGILPLFWIASLGVFLWARSAGGPTAAVIAVFLFTTIPPVLAHAGLVTTDMAATAFGIVTFYCSLWWAERPDRARTLVFGIALGLAALAKFSLLAYLPAGWVLLLLWRRPSRKTLRSYLAPLALAAVVGCLVIWAAYRFSFDRIPAPDLFAGIRGLLHHNAIGHDSYVLGARHRTGVWYFFPVVLGVKTPLAMLILLAWSLVRSWRRSLPVDAALACSLGILLVAMTGRINIGVRHVLPVYGGLAVICAVAAADIMRTAPRLLTGGLLALFAWQAISGSVAHPDYLAYTNEIAGDHPQKFVAESDLDWGQDMKLVAAFLERRGVTHVAFTPYCASYLDAGRDFPQVTPTDWYRPLPGWNIVSLSGLEVYDHPGWANRIPPHARIGRTHWAYFFP